ncbi:MAG: AraC family transcriptional regulator ligand-binding domain-containing protein [Halioglobus sp.]|nr:AraC family transcriptional regulator ligand-binding domain-containing protein [Halioglobus sp.]
MPRTIELSAAYARLTLQSGVAPAEELLRGVNLSEEALAGMEFIDAPDLAQLFRNYDRHVQDRAWTTRLGAQFNIAAHGPLGFAALSAPTLGEALDVMGTLNESRNTALNARTYATSTHYVLRLEDATGEPDFAQWLMEVVSKVLEELLSAILGHPVGKNVLISLSHPPPQDAELVIAGYDGTVIFGAAQNSIAVPLAWRHLPSPLFDESVYRANVIKCRELIAAREQVGSIAVALRNRLTNHFDTQLLQPGGASSPPTLEQVAELMHLTPRTLIRKLQREETAYKNVLESLRREYAERLLQDARLKVADVAEILGYREAANFTRAFKRWYGESPAAWRRR